ncbi:molecular chaperone [Klebsiella indica]|uniref:fimbrial biogenesis chaperone n=1 Tax=Klebsiella TaxID=570 RepID=UPI0031B68A6E
MKRVFFYILLQLVSVSSIAGLQLEATRVIYYSNNSSASLTLKNKTTQNYMLQTWLETADKKTDKGIPIQVVPPIMRVDAGKDATLRFIYSGSGLPTNRESLFWINNQEIPPASSKQNVLQIAVHSRLKLFYRPKEINTTLEKEVAKLKWQKIGNKVNVKNDGPMYISLNKLYGASKSAGSDVDIDMVAPFSSMTFNLPSSLMSLNKIDFSYINDYGGTTRVTGVLLK